MRINLISAILISICVITNICQEKLSLLVKDNVPEISSKNLNMPVNKFSLSDTSGECNITLTDGTLVKEAYMVNPGDSLFTIVKSGIGKDMPISRIHKIIFEKHNFWTGFAIGTLSSVCFWEILGISNAKNEPSAPLWGIVLGLICAPPVGLIGGLVAEFGSSDEIYNFSTINPSSRVLRLKKIISDHK